MAGGGIAGRLYRGEVSINFVRRQRTWYAISGVILLISVIALATRGLNFSLEFKGGSSFTFPNNSLTTQGAIARVVTGNGGGDATVPWRRAARDRARTTGARLRRTSSRPAGSPSAW